jgi:hypothetical protein
MRAACRCQIFLYKNRCRVRTRTYTRTRRSRPQRSVAYLHLLPAKSSTLCSHASSICAILALRPTLLSFALYVLILTQTTSKTISQMHPT